MPFVSSYLCCLSTDTPWVWLDTLEEFKTLAIFHLFCHGDLESLNILVRRGPLPNDQSYHLYHSQLAEEGTVAKHAFSAHVLAV